MRLLNSICKVIADNFPNVPVHIEQVPSDFIRPCFLVELVTEGDDIKNYFVYQNNPIFQIVYFGERDIANQALAEPLYTVRERLTELFLLSLAIPIVPREGVHEKKRYAKIESFTHSLHLDEGALFCNMKVNFTGDVTHSEDYDLMGHVVVNTKVNR